MNLQHIPRKKIVLIIGDVIAITSPIILVANFDGLAFEPNQSWFRTGMILFVYLACFYLADLHNLEKGVTHSAYVYRFLSTSVVAAGGSVIVVFLALDVELENRVFVLETTLILFSTLLWRLFLDVVFKKYFARKTTVAIVGSGKEAKAIYKSIEYNSMVEFVGFIEEDLDRRINIHRHLKTLGGTEILDEIAARGVVDKIVLAMTNTKGPDFFRRVLNCKMKGIDVLDASTFYEQMRGKIQVEHVTDSWLVRSPILGVRKSIYNCKIKGLIGVLLSISILLICLPLIVLTFIAIKLDSRGPAFYRQRRVGLNGGGFWLYKFRSMTVDAEHDGAVWAVKQDSRVTRVGKIIRKLRIDEIPQMWNVLKGDMNFFGPRPERPEFVEVLKREISYYDMRHIVKPGITGWAQVNYPYGASVSDALEKLKYDLFYIKNVSLSLDLHILLRTVRTVLFGIGAR